MIYSTYVHCVRFNKTLSYLAFLPLLHLTATTGSNGFGWNKRKIYDCWTNMKLLRFWVNGHHRDTNTHKDGQRDELTDEETVGGREEVKPQKKRKLVLKREKRESRRAEMEGEMAKRNHAWFTFNLSKGHGLPCGARAWVRPLWAEQWVLIVLLVGVVGVVLGHGNWDGGGEELAPLPRILEAAERARFILIPYIYKQDRHKEKNCREIWTHRLKER